MWQHKNLLQTLSLIVVSNKPIENKTTAATIPLEKKNEVKTEPIAKTTPKQDVAVNKPHNQQL